jgi:preprotein translocase subunit SecD
MRIGAIVAMFLGGLYILAPTLVQEDFETRLARAAASVDGSEAGEPEAAAPAWYAGYLPDTAISLGLDLQGGIDLTMQVGLEEALLGQANRDATYLVD